MTKTLKLKNCDALIDDEDFEFLNQWRWGFDGRYVYRREYLDKEYKKCKKIYIHRLIMNTPQGMDTDHINGNKLDNRRCNLRVATRSQNSMNKRQFVGASKYKGVFWSKRDSNWRAAIKINMRSKHLGSYETEEQAAQAYNEAAAKLFKEYSLLNLIKG